MSNNSRLLSVKIDVTKLDKNKFFHGEKGIYCDLDIWINEEPDRFGNDASVNQSQTKDERLDKVKKNYVGSAKKVLGWGDESQSRSNNDKREKMPDDHEEDDIPF